MTNVERFNDLLNSCQNPEAMYNALLALAPVIKEALPERFTDQEVINDIAATVRRYGVEVDGV